MRSNEFVSHRRLLQMVWGPDCGEELEHLSVLTNQVRKKLSLSLRGAGICFGSGTASAFLNEF
jgi:DNA-binding winged helix-turn-helix (wHTH) protein